jgi:putative acetyltransferase
LIRSYHRKDIPSIARLYYETVHHVNAKDYNADQINAWTPRVYNNTYWQRRFKHYKVFVAVDNCVICGFAELDVKTGQIDCFYVHHGWQRRGVGSRLLRRLIMEAKKHRLTRLHADVSITARPFFSAMGFAQIRPQTKFYRGRTFKQFVMAKPLRSRKKEPFQQPANSPVAETP